MRDPGSEGPIPKPATNSSGIYFLTGADAESDKPAIYIGEAENARDRIKAHLARDFWNQILFFASKDEGILQAQGDRLVFTADAEFMSPSAAAAVNHGGHANGLKAWKDKDGKTLKEIESD